MDVSTPMVLRFSFNLIGIVPNAPTTMGIMHLCPYALHLSDFSSEILIVFLLSRPLLLSPFHHLELPRL